MPNSAPLLFNNFVADVQNIPLPTEFTFPFYYEPHAIAVIASKELQQHLLAQNEWKHNFGLNNNVTQGQAIGKMFGVLVVQNQEGKLGYLAAFSGKLANGNHHSKFVPPVYDMLKEGDFFEHGGKEIVGINQRIEKLLNDSNYAIAQNELETQTIQANAELQALKLFVRQEKKKRKTIREKGKLELAPADYEVLHEKHRKQSFQQQFLLKEKSSNLEQHLENLKKKAAVFENEIQRLKSLRKVKSAALQERLFKEYQFINNEGIRKSLLEIFGQTALKRPPAGAGECAAPKLFQYAFLNNLKPIALAEFWWGVSPSADVKKHLHYYPACRGKCEPILNHMLKGIQLEKNPLIENLAKEKNIEIIYEDGDLLVINKPEELLSVPGKSIKDSVYTRIQQTHPQATGPLIVHRLDMSTSGILVLALNKRSHDFIQRQFIQRTIKKRYVALLEGVLNMNNGEINLPLCLDINDRPRQLVSHEYGKTATTKWEIIECCNGKTKVYFYPETGRTHQLRVHAAHQDGLNTPIVGDDLYGSKANRLHLHAEQITFQHPSTKKLVTFHVPEKF